MFLNRAFRNASRQFSTTRSNSSSLPSAQRPRARPNYKARENDLITMEDALKWQDMSPRQKVVYATKQTSYTGVIVAGLGMTSVLLYLVGAELVGKSDERKVYDMALGKVKDHAQVVEVLGEPILGVFEQVHGRRGQRALSHLMKLDVRQDASGQRKAFLKFPVSGSIQDGVVNVWLKDARGRWESEHVNVEVPGRRIVIEDTRQ